jgi:pimeloyl-ACP methyl ester carboxylesterase
MTCQLRHRLPDHHRTDAIPSREGRDVCVPPLWPRPWGPPPVPSALHEDTRQLGSGSHGRARVRTRSHSVRQRRRRTVHGNVSDTVQRMATHALAFLDGLGVMTCDVLGFSLGGMIAQQIAQDRPSMFSGRAPSERGTAHVSRLRACSLFQFHESFTRQAVAFLASGSPCAPY